MELLHFLVISICGIPAFFLGILWYYISIAFRKGVERARDFNRNYYLK